MQGAKMMQELIDKLCDHLTMERIKLFIESGFDEWETITFMKGEELVEMGFSAQECIVVMVAVNSQAKGAGEKEIFVEETMQRVLELAKEEERARLERYQQEEMMHKMEKTNIKQEEFQPQEQILKQFPPKPITQQILLKGVTLRGKEKVPLNKITLMSLQEKEITHICELEKVPHLQNLHLYHNHIYKIQNLEHLQKLRVLKLDSNEICKIQGMDNLINLQQLFLNDNHISKLQGLINNRRLHLMNMNNQKTKRNMIFEQQTCQALAYCLQTLHCDNNRVKDIANLGNLKVINTLYLKGNVLGDMEELSEPFGGMERLKKMDFRNNPLSALPKYRDYIVILCKNLQQLDNKKILPTQRQYLVKLYSLKHAKQVRDQTKQVKPSVGKKSDLQVTKLQQGMGLYSHGTDLRGNAAYANTKIQKH